MARVVPQLMSRASVRTQTGDVDEIFEKTAGTIDSEGWLHSGDKGTRGTHGMIKITGRCATGEHASDSVRVSVWTQTGDADEISQKTAGTIDSTA